MTQHDHEHHGENVMVGDGGDGQHHHRCHEVEVSPSRHHEPEISDNAPLVACPVMPNNLVNIERAACGPLWDAQPDKYAAA